MLLDAVDGHEVRQFEDVRGTGTVRKLAFSPNGSTLAAHQTRSSVIVWDPVSGCEVTLLETFGATAALLAIVADCTDRNPNVFYEIGLAHTIGKPTILITQREEDVPFDLRHLRYIRYQLTPRGMKEFETTFRETLRNVLTMHLS